MRKQTVAFDRKGYFGFCPILLSEIDDFAPVIEPRYRWLDPLLIMNEIIAGVVISIKTKLDDDYQPQYPVWGVKELRKPIYRDFEIED